MISRLEPCPVPPPITDPAEVVAERLRDRTFLGPALLEAMDYVFDQLGPDAKTSQSIECAFLSVSVTKAVWWYAHLATPTQRIITCLLAVEKLKDVS